MHLFCPLTFGIYSNLAESKRDDLFAHLISINEKTQKIALYIMKYIMISNYSLTVFSGLLSIALCKYNLGYVDPDELYQPYKLLFVLHEDIRTKNFTLF